MPVALTEMRNLLLPGLMTITSRYTWESVPEIIHTPTVSLATATAMGIGALLITNPMVSRRLIPWQMDR